MAKQNVKETSINKLIKVVAAAPSSDMKEVWLGWLSEYHTPGYYKRKPDMDYNARFMYMHHASPTGLLWLLQILGVDQRLVKLAESDYKRAGDDVHTQAAAIRKRVLWEVVDRAIAERIRALKEADKRKLLRMKKAAIN